MIFLFKQKTAYEMRISDWSSDVCSSDLAVAYAGRILAFSATAQDVDAALDRLKALIDGDFAERREQRSDAFPSEAEFERALALAERRLTGSHIHLLETLRDGNGEVHPLQLQRRAGVDEEMLKIGRAHV